jgi:hypothetical protein
MHCKSLSYILPSMRVIALFLMSFSLFASEIERSLLVSYNALLEALYIDHLTVIVNSVEDDGMMYTHKYSFGEQEALVVKSLLQNKSDLYSIIKEFQQKDQKVERMLERTQHKLDSFQNVKVNLSSISQKDFARHKNFQTKLILKRDKILQLSQDLKASFEQAVENFDEKSGRLEGLEALDELKLRLNSLGVIPDIELAVLEREQIEDMGLDVLSCRYSYTYPWKNERFFMEVDGKIMYRSSTISGLKKLVRENVPYYAYFHPCENDFDLFSGYVNTQESFEHFQKSLEKVVIPEKFRGVR